MERGVLLESARQILDRVIPVGCIWLHPSHSSQEEQHRNGFVSVRFVWFLLTVVVLVTATSSRACQHGKLKGAVLCTRSNHTKACPFGCSPSLHI